MAAENEGSNNGTRWAPRVWLALRICIALLALFALRRELSHVSLADVGRQIVDFGWRPIVAALVCAAGSFLTLGVFEVMGLRDTAGYDDSRAARKVPARVAFITSFVANAFSQSIGLAVLTGGAVRVRAYSRYGLTGIAIARISAFVTITATLGLLAAGAVALLESPASLPGRFTISLRAFGLILSLPAVAYVGWALIGRGNIGGKRWSMRPPTRRMAFAQVALSVFDWLLTGTVLFALLQASTQIGYFGFLGIYLVAQTAGVVSHVPGGFGIFEGAFLSLLSTTSAGPGASVLAASLVMYRVIYYLVPLVVAMVIAGLADLRFKGIMKIHTARRTDAFVHDGIRAG